VRRTSRAQIDILAKLSFEMPAYGAAPDAGFDDDDAEGNPA